MSPEAKRNMNVVLVAAHPDDVAYGCGGTALLLRDKGYKLHLIALTSGQRGIKGKSPDEAQEIREAEQRSACEMLGAELHLMREMDGELYAGREICEKVGALLKTIDPLAVFSLWPINVRDHSASAEIVQKALYFADMYYTTELYYYETSIGGQTNQFTPDIYVNIAAVKDEKIRLLACHKSQTGTPGEGILSEHRFRGRECRVEYAEGFKPVHRLVGSRWERRSTYLLLDL